MYAGFSRDRREHGLGNDGVRNGRHGWHAPSVPVRAELR
jgi:hypothetical protein